MSLQAGDILLFRANTGISKLIAWGTSSIYSHTAICVDPDKCLVIEAQGSVRAADIRKLKDYDIYRVIPGYIYDLDNVISFLVSKLNEKYDYAGVIFLGILKLFRLKGIANKWQRSKDWFCSELVYKAFSMGGLDIIPEVDNASIASPADIANSEVLKKI